MGWARTFAATFDANLRGQIRAYTLTGWTITSVLSPILLFAGAWMAIRVLGGDPSPDKFEAATGYPSYLAFVVLGVAFHGLATSSLEDGANAVYEEESNGTWDVLELAPFNRFVWMGGKTLAGLVTGFIDFFAVLALGFFVFDFAPSPRGLLLALLGIALTLVGLQGIAYAMAAVGLKWKQPWAIAFLLTPVLVLFSGMIVPVETLPPWGRVVAEALPLTHGLRVVRDAVILDAGFLDVAPELAWLVVTGAILGLLGYAAFRVLERRARETGVLGRY